MEYLLRNNKKVDIRKPKIDEAEEIISVVKKADEETKFLARNPGEFSITVEKEKEKIESALESNDREWFVAEYEGKIVGQCSVGLVRKNERYRHRAEVSFMVLQDYCNLGIGGKMMEECIKWCKDNGITQIELDVVKGNDRALNMYKNFGFEIIGTRENALRYLDGTYADEYMMVKKI